MAWFEAHETLARHPKTLKLARLLKAERRYAVGLLHDLFSWGLTAADKNGCLSGLEASDIASALDAPAGKKAQALVDALVASEYLDFRNGAYYIHNWYDYAGKLMDKREADRKRKAEMRQNSN